MGPATRVLVCLFIVSDAAGLENVYDFSDAFTCIVLGAKPEFPISYDELHVLRHRVGVMGQPDLNMRNLDNASVRRRPNAQDDSFALDEGVAGAWSDGESVDRSGMSPRDRESGFDEEVAIAHVEDNDPLDPLDAKFFSRTGDFPDSRWDAALAASNVEVTIEQLHQSPYNMDPLKESPRMTFRLQKYLGKGATGFVYSAVDAEGKLVAVKFSKMQTEAMTRARRDRNALNNEILHEYKVLQMLEDHPNVPNAIAIGKMEGDMDWCVVMVSEFAGQDIYQMQHALRDRKLTDEEMYVYGIKLVDALRVLHSKFRIIHGDVKLPNILIRKAGTGNPADDELFLADFGTAKSYVSEHDGTHKEDFKVSKREGTPTHTSTRVISFHTPGRMDDMFAGLLSIMEMGQYYPQVERDNRMDAVRNRVVLDHDDSWLERMKAKNNFPQAFIDLWPTVYLGRESVLSPFYHPTSQGRLQSRSYLDPQGGSKTPQRDDRWKSNPRYDFWRDTLAKDGNLFLREVDAEYSFSTTHFDL